MKVAAQLYTLREFLKTPEDIEKTLKRVKEIGYDAVQVSGMGSIDPQDLNTIVEREGLTICATHIGFDRLQNNLDSVINDHKLWGCKNVGLGIMPMEYRKDKAGFKKFAKEVSDIADKLQQNGLQFIYHNHNFEFVKFGNKTGMDILLENSNQSIDFEIDTYWVQSGGADPAQWITKVAGRMDVVHFKDMAVDDSGEILMAEVGEGNLNWDRIIQVCEDIGVEWVCVEQDVCQRDPFESLTISLKNLKEMGL